MHMEKMNGIHKQVTDKTRDLAGMYQSSMQFMKPSRKQLQYYMQHTGMATPTFGMYVSWKGIS